MEVTAISTLNQATVQVAGVRAPTQSPRQSVEESSQQTVTLAQARAETARQAELQQKAEERQTTKATPNEAPPSVGRIRFELEEGARVAKFFDTKDILIYQVPPDGTLYIVKAQESSGQDQVETSA